MAMYLRYMGEFLSRASVAWRAEIWQEAETAFAKVGSLTFEADEPLKIEWGNTAKSDPICSSSATLKIESPADRTYTDLYTITPGAVRLDVYRQGRLYWSGTLDPEFYEEPYERLDKYAVSLTFSDFGILDRLKYDLIGLQSLEKILLNALERSGINYAGIDFTSLCSTYFDRDKTEAATIDRLFLRSDNFTDEDGEQSTLHDVVEGMLRPLALRMIQRCGKIYVYDLNGLWNNAPTHEVYWTGTSQTLSVDEVYNNVVITFSPYAEEMLIDTELEYTEPYSSDQVNTTNYTENPPLNYYSYGTDYSQENKPVGRYGDWENVNFTIFLSDKGSGLAYLNPKAKYAHILPMVNGPEETDCVAWSVVAGHDSIKYHPENCHQMLNKVNGRDVTTPLMKTQQAFLPMLSVEERKNYYIRLTLPMLLDVRYNPFTSADESNESGHYKDLQEYAPWIFIPVAVNLYDENGVAIAHYENHFRTIKGAQGSIPHSFRGGEWVDGPAPALSKCWLAYYDVDGVKGKTAAGQWSENRQNIGRPDNADRRTLEQRLFSDYNMKFRIYESFKNMPSGEFIPYPPKAGFIEITVLTGVRVFRWNENENSIYSFDLGWYKEAGDVTAPIWVRDSLYDRIRWLLYKAPNLEIVKNNLIFDSTQLDDVEYRGELNKDAKEELSISNTCGTLADVSPSARGLYFCAPLETQVMQLTRGNVTDLAENLFIGTLYSQYAQRMTSLSGENAIDPSGLNAYSEPNQPGLKFIMVEDNQDVIADTSESVFIQLNPDIYRPKKD